jgi:hypothetical protein
MGMQRHIVPAIISVGARSFSISFILKERRFARSLRGMTSGHS